MNADASSSQTPKSENPNPPFANNKESINALTTCAHCGKTANARTFCGRFCSKQCVGKNAARHRMKALKVSRKMNGKGHSKPVHSSAILYPHQQQARSHKIRRSSSTFAKIQNYDVYEPKRKNTRTISVKKEQFSWDDYLTSQHATAVPVDSFSRLTTMNPFPSASNNFKVGWLMEAVDPQNQSVFALVSVVSVLGQRLRIHFEGYPSVYDCWVYVESRFIFPCGFCAKTSRTLSPPYGYDMDGLNLSRYAHEQGLKIAPEEAFPHRCYDNLSGFDVHDRCEAVDRQNPELICVASIADILGPYVLVHFDGWDPCFDYWTLHDSNYIKPIGWCAENHKQLAIPLGYEENTEFDWKKYLTSNNWKAADVSLFSDEKHEFKSGMKLEVVDPRNQILLRVASIADIDDYRVKIHFDGWSEEYDLWIDADSSDLHPAGYSANAGEELLCPTDFASVHEDNGACPVPCCLGHGHVMADKFSSHHTTFGCPYSTQNMHREPLQERLTFGRKQSFDVDEVAGNSRRLKRDFTVRKKRRRSRILSQPAIGGRTTSSDQSKPFYTSKSSIHLSSTEMRECVQRSLDLDIAYYNNETTYLLSDKHHQREMSKTWEKHVLSLPGVKGKTASEVSKWTIERVASFIHEVTGKDNYGNAFTDQEIDGEAFLMLTQSDLSSVLKLKLGPSVKIYNAIVCIKRNKT